MVEIEDSSSKQSSPEHLLVSATSSQDTVIKIEDVTQAALQQVHDNAEPNPVLKNQSSSISVSDINKSSLPSIPEKPLDYSRNNLRSHAVLSNTTTFPEFTYDRLPYLVFQPLSKTHLSDVKTLQVSHV